MEQFLLQSFKQYWKTHFPYLQPSNAKLIVAVSGGVDSIVLAHILDSLHFDFVIAHCNFHLRGEESDRDENFVQQYAKTIGKVFVCRHFDTISFARDKKISIEEAARDLRYSWFRKLAQEGKTGVYPLPIFVAHHANDNIETVLMNFFRGCGIAGLHGILPLKEGIFRPLLFAKRNDIISYALTNQLQWIEDSSNMDERFTRNFLRHNILPELKENYPTIEDNILENIQRFREVENIYAHYIGYIKNKVCQFVEGNHIIHIDKLKQEDSLATIVYELFKEYGFSNTQTHEIIKLLDADSGARLASATHTIWKDRDVLIVAVKKSGVSVPLILNQLDTKLNLPDGGVLTTEKITNDSSVNTITLDMSAFKFPLEVRHWQEGDFFYPTGMQGKKKLSKYFIDEKIPTPMKHRLWIVTSDEKIVWIVGLRGDRRFVPKKNSPHLYYLTYIQPS